MRRFALVLHTHIPYVRRNGTWPCGEDFFHQAATESYLPLLGVFDRLAAGGIRDAATIAITPILAEQMQDEHMRRQLSWYLGTIELRAIRQATTFKGDSGVSARAIKDIAAMYARFGREQWARLESLGGDMTRGFAALEAAGVVELAGGPATHPLLSQLSAGSAELQLRTGLDAHQRIFGHRPSAIWAPECATRPGLENVLAACGVSRVIVAGLPAGAPARAGDSSVTMIPLDRETMQHVWCPDGGYPAAEWYRDFHHYDLVAGFKNWRVTSRGPTTDGKEIYDPSHARDAAAADARAFVATLARRFDDTGRDLIVAAFDTELLGHWWFEGPVWLEEVLRLLSSHPTIRPTTLSEIETPAAQEPMPGTTWGDGGDLRSWITPDTEPMWKRLREADAETASLLGAAPAPSPARTQLLRELMLLQSSDWPWLVVKGDNAEYAQQRFDTHYDRWSWLADAIKHSKPWETLVDDLSPIDNSPALPS